MIADLAKTMAWAGVIFPLLFITDSRVSLVYSKARPSDQIAATPSDIASSPPIVLVVFDELPLWTLVGPDGRINHHRYPNFSRFADKATWFVNGGTVTDSTRHAIPAILTGRFPTDRDATATLTAFPNNLFPWLQQNAYRLVAAEHATRLCPEEACEEAQLREARLSRWSSTAADVRLMVLHRVFPPEWESGLPSIEGEWRDFKGPQRLKNRAVDEFLSLVQSIDDRDGTFYFLHSRLPHVPWIYTARGARYKARVLPQGIRRERWNSNSWLTVQGFQRHIQQTQFADHLFGRLLDRLESEGVFDRALVIVLADHGVSFRTNLTRRGMGHENWNDVVAIPFFVKRPWQELGQRSDRPVASIDVPETIADVLGRRLPWASDGQSVFNPEPRRGRTRRGVATHNLTERFYPATLSGQSTIRRKLSLFGTGEDPESIFRVGDVDGLVGRRISDIEYVDSPLTVIVRDDHQYRNVNLESGRLPVWMRGKILGQPLTTPRLRLAISLNETIVAVTETFIDNNRQIAFRALLPEGKFRGGVNPFGVFVIQATPTGIQPARVRNPTWGWKLDTHEGRLSLVSDTGERGIPVRTGDFAVGLSRIARGPRRTHFVGWAVAVDGGEEEVFAAFVENGVAEFVVATSVERHGIARRYLGRATDDRKSGFRISVPNDHLKGKDQRLFAFTSKSAVEIPIPQQ